VPCPLMPEPTVSRIFHVDSISEMRMRIIEVLERYGIPYVTFPDENNIVSCRMRFILDPNDKALTFSLDLDRICIDFSRKTDEILSQVGMKALKVIDFAVALLKEVGLVNKENEAWIRETMILDWEEVIEVPRTLLPYFLNKIMRSV